MHQLEGIAQLWQTEFSSRHTESPLGIATAVGAGSIVAAASPMIVIPITSLEVIRIVRCSGFAWDAANSGHLHLLNLDTYVYAAGGAGVVLANSGYVGDDTLLGSNGAAIDKFEDQAFVWDDAPNAAPFSPLGLQVSGDIRNDDAVNAHNVTFNIQVTWELWRLVRRR